MSGASWGVWLVAAVAAFGAAGYLYRFRETPGRGRAVLTALRGTALALLLLLVFDPSLAGPARTGSDRLVLLDASASMAMPARSGAGTRWTDGLSRVRQASAQSVMLFGSAPRAASLDSLAAEPPGDPQSRLLPALQAAAEAGARRVVVITDGGLDDTDDVVRWLPRLGLAIEVRDVGGAIGNAAVTRATAPSWVEAGEPLLIAFEVMAIGPGPDSLDIRVQKEGAEAGRTRIARPGPGRFASGSVRVVAEPVDTDRYVRYDVALEPGDDAPLDDVRHVYTEVSAQPAGAVILSLQPDWETRFLYPVLDRTLGLPIRSFLLAGTAWIEQGDAGRAGRRIAERDVLAAVGRAALVVLQGGDAAAPSRVLEAATAASRLLVFPSGSGRLSALPLPHTTPIAGDWYVSAQIPPSPVAQALAGVDVDELPPLDALRIPDDVPGAWAAMNVNRGRRGAAYPLAIGGRTGARRWVVALGQGYWRWALRGGAQRASYERLWSALGGWLTEDLTAIATAVPAPAARVLEKGAPVYWRVPAAASGALRLEVRDSAGALVTDTIVDPAGADSVATAALRPGRYRWVANMGAGAGAVGAQGELTVEHATAENIRIGSADRLAAGLSESRPAARRTGSRPLHTAAWPYITVILLLCAEWMLRRRWGLR